jgi:N-methylhydantoinase A/oxoprolinase/acetone carboxylase beta subunit
MVKAVDAQTRGLGGDSEISMGPEKEIVVGPRRAIPLCLMSEQYPGAVDALKLQLKLESGKAAAGNGRFFLKRVFEKPGTANLTQKHHDILASLNHEPVSEFALTADKEHPFLFLRYVDDLIERGLVLTSAFTPTDAVNVLGLYESGSLEASRLGASLWAGKIGTDAEAFCRAVLSRVELGLAHEIVSHALYNEGAAVPFHKDARNPTLIDRALRGEKNNNLSITLSINRPLVAIGAPVGTYFPSVAEMLNGRLLIPEHAPVASAVGAVAGGVLQTVRVLIKPLLDRRMHRVHLPDGIRDFDAYPSAVSHAEQVAREVAEKRAIRAGAKRVETTLTRRVNTLPHDDEQEEGEIYIDAEITATAMGRPDLGGSGTG